LKLLLDQNLSFSLLARLEPLFPGSTQVSRVGLKGADDTAVWEFARAGGYAIVTKDSDFFERSLVSGFPPQVIWLKCGNRTSQQIEEILVRSQVMIRTFLLEKRAACLEIY
jgi:predicted nuclease of predicted toxin-antitoxin system